MPACVLCDQDSEVSAGPLHHPNRADLWGVSCPRCGRYFYDYFSMHHVITEELKDVRYVLSGALRGRFERGEQNAVELTTASV